MCGQEKNVRFLVDQTTKITYKITVKLKNGKKKRKVGKGCRFPWLMSV